MFSPMTLKTIDEARVYNTEMEYNFVRYNFDLSLSCPDDEDESEIEEDWDQLEWAMEEYFDTYGTRNNYCRS